MTVRPPADSETVIAADVRPGDLIWSIHSGWVEVVAVELAGDMVYVTTSPRTGEEPLAAAKADRVVRHRERAPRPRS